MCDGICSMCNCCTVVINNQAQENKQEEVQENIPEFEVRKTFLGKYVGKEKNAKLKLIGN